MVEWRLIPPPCAWRLLCDCIRLIIVAIIPGSHHGCLARESQHYLRAGRIQAGPRLSHMASASDKYSAEALKCQCRGCSNCNRWRNDGSPYTANWLMKTRNRCGENTRKKYWDLYRCPYCHGCWGAREMEGLDNLDLPPPPPPDDDAGAHPLYLRLRRLATKPSSRSECCGPSWRRCKENWIQRPIASQRSRAPWAAWKL